MNEIILSNYYFSDWCGLENPTLQCHTLIFGSAVIKCFTIGAGIIPVSGQTLSLHLVEWGQSGI